VPLRTGPDTAKVGGRAERTGAGAHHTGAMHATYASLQTRLVRRQQGLLPATVGHQAPLCEVFYPLGGEGACFLDKPVSKTLFGHQTGATSLDEYDRKWPSPLSLSQHFTVLHPWRRCEVRVLPNRRAALMHL
jgi:hypothetical protein